jgi:ATP-binding cassette subfamily B protein
VVSGITTLKLYTSEQVEIERFKELNNEYIARHMRVARFRGFLWPFLLFVFAIVELVILLVGGRQVIQQELTIGQLLQFNVMVSHLGFPLFSLGWVMSLIQQGISAMGRINYILDYPVETRDDWQMLESDELNFTARNLNYRYPEHRSRVPSPMTQKGNGSGLTSRKKADAAMPEQTSEADVLDGITLSIESGQVIGITGTIGSGKSTLVNLMTGLFKPEPDMLFINGVDIRDIHPASLFDKVSVVPQEPFLFSRTLAENIALGADGEVKMGAIKDAVRKAGLERDIETFPDQYDQIVGERGITLSGGQKQRAAIARALRKQSPVLIFDDALSSVDAQTESEILEHLKALDQFKTLIIVSHRISALRDADAIYVLDQGKIVEQGTHSELIQQGNLYSRLAKMQQMEEVFSE